MKNELIEQLAQKLGTTVEHLWSVIIRQAPLFVVYTLIELALTLGASFLLWRAHKHFSNDDNEMSYYHDDGIGISMVVVTIDIGLFLIYFAFSINSVITAIFNPEYWALQEILEALKK